MSCSLSPSCWLRWRSLWPEEPAAAMDHFPSPPPHHSPSLRPSQPTSNSHSLSQPQPQHQLQSRSSQPTSTTFTYTSNSTPTPDLPPTVPFNPFLYLEVPLQPNINLNHNHNFNPNLSTLFHSPSQSFIVSHSSSCNYFAISLPLPDSLTLQVLQAKLS